MNFNSWGLRAGVFFATYVAFAPTSLAANASSAATMRRAEHGGPSTNRGGPSSYPTVRPSSGPASNPSTVPATQTTEALAAANEDRSDDARKQANESACGGRLEWPDVDRLPMPALAPPKRDDPANPLNLPKAFFGLLGAWGGNVGDFLGDVGSPLVSLLTSTWWKSHDAAARSEKVQSVIREQLDSRRSAKTKALLASQLNDEEFKLVLAHIGGRFAAIKNAPDQVEVQRFVQYIFVYFIVVKKLGEAGISCDKAALYNLANQVLTSFAECQGRARNATQVAACTDRPSHTLPFQIGHLLTQLLISDAVNARPELSSDEREKYKTYAAERFERCGYPQVLRSQGDEQILNAQACVGEALLATVHSIAEDQLNAELEPYVSDRQERARIIKLNVFGQLMPRCDFPDAVAGAANPEGLRKRLRAMFAQPKGAEAFRRQMDVCTDEVTLQGSVAAQEVIAKRLTSTWLTGKSAKMGDEFRDQAARQIRQCEGEGLKQDAIARSPSTGTAVKGCVTREMMILALRTGARAADDDLPSIPSPYAKGTNLSAMHGLIDQARSACVYSEVNQPCTQRIYEFAKIVRAMDPRDPQLEEKMRVALLKSPLADDLIEGTISAKFGAMLKTTLAPQRTADDKDDMMGIAIRRVQTPEFLGRLLQDLPQGRELMTSIKAKLIADKTYDAGEDPSVMADFKNLLAIGNGPDSFPYISLRALAAPTFESRFPLPTWKAWGAAIPHQPWSVQYPGFNYDEVMTSKEGRKAIDYFRAQILIPMLRGNLSHTQQVDRQKDLAAMIEAAVYTTKQKRR